MALSGGSDSSALAVLVRETYPGHRLIGAHFVHGARSKAAHARDQEVVRDLCTSLDIPLIVGDSSDFPVRFAGGPEDTFRRARYAFFQSVVRSTSARSLLTGHTEDDQIETVVMRLLALSDGVTLAGIPRVRPLGDDCAVIRPLLGLRREQLRSILRKAGVLWADDESNQSDAYRRNRIRNTILPAIRSVYPCIERDVLSLQKGMERTRIRVEQRSVELLSSAERTPTSVQLRKNAFFDEEREIRLDFLYRALAHIGAMDPSNRPGHRFFAPLLQKRPDHGGVLLAGRGIRVIARGQSLRIDRELSEK